MGTCLCCGKKGFFLRLSEKGLCYDCANGGYVKKLISDVPSLIRELLYIDVCLEDPSSIDTRLDAFDFSYNGLEELGYSPSYKYLEPGQKYIYLKWLQDGAKSNVNIGYVFIYLYCLERRMTNINSYYQAKQELIRLLKVFNDTKIVNYAKLSLLLGAVINQDIETLNYCLKKYEYSFTILLSISCLSEKNGVNMSAYHIVKYYKDFGYSKSKFIENNCAELEKLLEDIFSNLYNSNTIFIPNNELFKVTSDFGQEFFIEFINSSLKTDKVIMIDINQYRKDIIKGMLLFSVNVLKSKGKLNINSISDEQGFFKVNEDYEMSLEQKRQDKRKLPDDIILLDYDVSFIYENINIPVINVNTEKYNLDYLYRLLNNDDFSTFLSIFPNIENYMDPSELHFLYLILNDHYYKLRNCDSFFINETKKICQKDIALMDCGYFSPSAGASVPTLNRLINLYEAEGKNYEAIELCKFGLNKLINPKMINGFNGRISDLYKKIKKAPN